MSDTTQLLESLRDIQEPLPPEGASLLLLAGNAFLLFAIIAWLTSRFFQRKNAWKKQALRQLAMARSADTDKAMLQMATLLRQLLLHRQHATEQLTGKPYLQLLDKEFKTQWFTQGDGQHFGDSLYQPLSDRTIDAKQLNRRLTVLVKALPHKTKQTPA